MIDDNFTDIQTETFGVLIYDRFECRMKENLMVFRIKDWRLRRIIKMTKLKGADITACNGKGEEWMNIINIQKGSDITKP